MQVLLGSNSPRRRELMTGLEIPYRVVSLDCDESFPLDFCEGDIPLYIAKAKAATYTQPLTADEVLLTADTIVWAAGQMLGKPTNEEDAQRMLRVLSGRTHQVYTGVCITTLKEQHSFVDCTDVTFKQLTEQEIKYYVEHYHPLDKAGAYGIQEWIGYIGVTAIRGSYFNVMGLPVHRIAEALTRLQ